MRALYPTRPFRVFAAFAASVVFVVAANGLFGARAVSQTAVNRPAPQPAAVKLLVTASKVNHVPIRELSGIAKSRTYPNTYWVHNDSGDSARIFAIDDKGVVIVPPFLRSRYSIGASETNDKLFWPGLPVDDATNYDWEDIAVDGDTIYIADTGNNGNARRDLGVYVLAEPNPQAVEHARALKWLPVAYEDQTKFPPSEWDFDCEAIFARAGKLYFVTKHRGMGNINLPKASANLYRMDTQYTDRINVLKKIDSKNDTGGFVTAASLSPDGKTLAVLAHLPMPSVWLFEAASGTDKFLSGKARRLMLSGAGQAEAICWDDNATLRIANEQNDIFVVKVSEFKTASRRNLPTARRRTARR